MFKSFSRTLLSAFVLGFVILSCSQKDVKDPAVLAAQQDLLKPYSTGKISELYLYIDDVYRALPLRDSVRLYLDVPYLLVPTPTPVVDLQERSAAAFANGNDRNASNLFIVNINEDSDLRDFVFDNLGPENVNAALEGKKMTLVSQKDVNSKPQKLFFLLTSEYPNLSDRQVRAQLKDYFRQITEEITAIDNQRIISSMVTRKNKTLEDLFSDKFNLDLIVPREYEYVDSTDNFLWVIKETDEIYSNIVGWKSDISADNLADKVITVRAPVGDKIPSQNEGSKMITSIDRLPLPIQKEIEIDGITVYETRGLWKIANDNLGGGFLNYTWADDTGQVYSLDGFTYTSEEEESRRVMRDIDAIFSSLRLTD